MRDVRLFALSLLIAVTAALGAIGATTALTGDVSVVADGTPDDTHW